MRTLPDGLYLRFGGTPEDAYSDANQPAIPMHSSR
jgi:hypothetical protein